MADLSIALEIVGRDLASGPLNEVMRAMDGTGAKAITTSQAMMGVGAAMTAVGVAGASMFGGAISAASEFEHTMSGVKAVMTPDEVNEFGASLEALALKLGKDTVFSAKEAAQGLEELVKGGVSATDILDGAAAAALNLAAAGGVPIKDAAEIASNAMNMFSLSGGDMAHVADLIAGAANASSMEVGDFKFALSQAGAVARTVGLSFDDTAVAISLLAAQGLKGSDAGTSLKTMLINLVPQTKAAKDAFKDYGFMTLNAETVMRELIERGIDPANMALGDQLNALKMAITGWDGAKKMTTDQKKAWEEAQDALHVYSNAFFDNEGHVRSLTEISGLLNTQLNHLTEEEKIEALKKLFGTDAMRAGAILMREGAEGAEAMADAMGKVTAEAVGMARMDNLNGSLEQLKGSFETLQITIGQRFLPIVRDLVDRGTGLLNMFLELPEPVQNTAIAVAAVVTVVGLLGGPLLILIGALPLIAAGFAVVGPAIAAVALPVVLITGLIALLAAAWINDWGDIREHTADAIQFISDGLTSWGFIFDQVGTAVQAFATGVGSFFDQLGTNVRAVLDGLGAALHFAFVDGPQALVDAVRQWVQDIATTIGNAFDALGTTIHDAWQSYVDFIQGVLDAIGAAVAAAWEAIPADIRDSLAAIGANIEERWTGFVTFIGDRLSDLGTAIHDGWQAYANWIDDRLADISSAVTTIWTTITGFIGDRLNDIGAGITEKWNGFTAFIGEKAEAIRAVVQEKWDALLALTGQAWEAIRNKIGDLLAGAGGALSLVTNWVASVLTALGKFATDAGTKALEIGAGIVAGIQKGITDNWEAFKGWFGDQVRGVLNAIKEQLGIHSPSQVAGEELGTPIGEGIVTYAGNAIADGAHVILEQVTALMGQARQAINGGGAAYIGGGLGTASGTGGGLGGVIGTGLTGTGGIPLGIGGGPNSGGAGSAHPGGGGAPPTGNPPGGTYQNIPPGQTYGQIYGGTYPYNTTGTYPGSTIGGGGGGAAPTGPPANLWNPYANPPPGWTQDEWYAWLTGGSVIAGNPSLNSFDALGPLKNMSTYADTSLASMMDNCCCCPEGEAPGMLKPPLFSGVDTPGILSKIPFSGVDTPGLLNKILFSGVDTPGLLTKTLFSGVDTPGLLNKILFSGVDVPGGTGKGYSGVDVPGPLGKGYPGVDVPAGTGKGYSGVDTPGAGKPPVVINQTISVTGTSPDELMRQNDLWLARAQWQAGIA